jgi:hypothetical protein
MTQKVKRAHTLFFLPIKSKLQSYQLFTNNSFKKERRPTKNMQILTIYYALGAVLLQLATIHEISAYDHSEEIDDFQIDVDREVDVVSC